MLRNLVMLVIKIKYVHGIGDWWNTLNLFYDNNSTSKVRSTYNLIEQIACDL